MCENEVSPSDILSSSGSFSMLRAWSVQKLRNLLGQHLTHTIGFSNVACRCQIAIRLASRRYRLSCCQNALHSYFLPLNLRLCRQAFV